LPLSLLVLACVACSSASPADGDDPPLPSPTTDAGAKTDAAKPEPGNDAGAKGDAAPRPSGPPKTDGTYTAHANLTYASGSAHALDLWVPNGKGPFPVVIYVHGGGWLEGDRSEGIPIAEHMAPRGYAVASVDYRLSQTAKFPAQIQDVKAAVRWLRAKASTYDLDVERFASWGESAGGHLAMLLGTSGGVAALEDASQGNGTQSSRVQAVVDWFGPTDFLQMDAQTVQGCANAHHDAADSPESKLVGCTIQSCPQKVAQANPITFVDAADPPHVLMHGSKDCTVPTGQAKIMAAALGNAGVKATLVVVNGMGHDADPLLNDGAKMAQVDAFLDATLYAP
jgi:acetyl esterase/lipase